MHTQAHFSMVQTYFFNGADLFFRCCRLIFAGADPFSSAWARFRMYADTLTRLIRFPTCTRLSRFQSCPSTSILTCYALVLACSHPFSFIRVSFSLIQVHSHLFTSVFSCTYCVCFCSVCMPVHVCPHPSMLVCIHFYSFTFVPTCTGSTFITCTHLRWCRFMSRPPAHLLTSALVCTSLLVLVHVYLRSFVLAGLTRLSNSTSVC